MVLRYTVEGEKRGNRPCICCYYPVDGSNVKGLNAIFTRQIGYLLYKSHRSKSLIYMTCNVALYDTVFGQIISC